MIDLKKIRSIMNMSQQAIADDIGVPKARYAKWEERGTVPKKEDFDVVTTYLTTKVIKYPDLEPYVESAIPFGLEDMEASKLEETGACR